MSIDSKIFSSLFLCFVVAFIAGCDSAEEKTVDAKVDEKKVAEVKTPEVKTKKVHPTKDMTPDPNRIPTENDTKGELVTKKLPPKGEDVPKTSGDKPLIKPLKTFEVSVAEGGALTFAAPEAWKKVKPRSFVVEYEIAVPKSTGEDADAKDGRLTIMGAGGSVDDNLNRWYDQYSQPDGRDTKDVAKVTESTVAGCKVVWVDISGTLLDKPGGPMAGGAVVERKNYRTIAAIIQANEHGQYFVKLYGPKKTITDNQAAFIGFVDSLKVNDEAKGL